MDQYLFAGICVRDFAAAVDWYTRFFGDGPSMVAHDTEVVWNLADRQSVYVVERAEHAGHAFVTFFLDRPTDLDDVVAAIAARGIDPTEWERYDNGVSKVIFHDCDGNEISYGAGPSGESAG